MVETLTVPGSGDDLTPEWFARCFSQYFGRDITVEKVEALPLMGGIPVTSEVQRWSLEGGDGLPASVIVKMNRDSWVQKRGTALYERELRFYSELSSELQAPVPACYLAKADREGKNFVFVLEDLSEAKPGHCLDGVSVEQCRDAMLALARFQRAWWKAPVLETWPKKSSTREGLEKYVAHFEETWPKLLELGRYPISELLRDRVQNSDYEEYIEQAVSSTGRATTLVHGDLHGENFILDGSHLKIFDWQNASCGHPSIDAAQLLGAMGAEHLPGHWREVLEAYCESLGEDGFEDMVAAVRAQTRTVFMGVASWLVIFESESLRDAATIQNYWKRLSALFLSLT